MLQHTYMCPTIGRVNCNNHVLSLAMHPTQGHIIVAGTGGGTLFEIDTRALNEAPRSCSPSPSAVPINHISFVDTSKPTTVATANGDGSVRLYEFDTDQWRVQNHSLVGSHRDYARKVAEPAAAVELLRCHRLLTPVS